MMPDRPMSPTVGLSPTSPQADDGLTIDPSVSVPTPTTHRPAATAAPVPELDPEALRSSAYGFFVNPPRALHPLVEFDERKLAHSLRFVLPRMTAPASRSLRATAESFGRFAPTRASDPAVVCILSAVSMLSLIRIGMPCNGPRGPFSLRSLSRSAAIARASGFTSMTLLTAGPLRSISSIRARYFSVRVWEVSDPALSRASRSARVASPNSNGLTSGLARLRLAVASATAAAPRRSSRRDGLDSSGTDGSGGGRRPLWLRRGGSATGDAPLRTVGVPALAGVG